MLKLFNRKNKKGFTLIELIVVIAIVAILAAVILPRLAGFREIARRSNDETFAASMASAAAAYLASKPNYWTVETVAEQSALYALLASTKLIDSTYVDVPAVELALQSTSYAGLQMYWDGEAVTVWLLDQTAGGTAPPLAGDILYTITK